jgi:hypothetical protein
MNDVNISQREVDELFQDIDGPVGLLMREIADHIAFVAAATVRVLDPSNRKMTWNFHSSAYYTDPGRRGGAFKPPGYTKRNITTTVGHAKLHNDYVFGGANAPGNPGLFLEEPAEQEHSKHPFLTTGLWSVEGWL